MKRKLIIPFFVFGSLIYMLTGCDTATQNIDPPRTSEYFDWARNAGPSGGSVGLGCEMDEAGNSYVIGTFYQTAKFDSVKLSLPAEGEFIAKFSAAGDILWAVYLDGTEGTVFDLAVDNSGNVSLAGHFSAGAKLLPKNQTIDAESSVLKFDTNGTMISSIPGDGIASRIYLDSSGKIYTANVIDAASGNILRKSMLAGQIYFNKYSADGTKIFSKEFADPNGAEIKSIAVDFNGNILIGGTFLGTLNIDSHEITTTSTYAFYIMKFDQNGNYIWSNIGSSESIGESLAIDPQGNTVFYGLYDYAMQIDSVTFIAFATRGMFLAKYGPDGKLIKAANVAAQPMSNGDMKLDPEGNVYLANGFYGIVNVLGVDLTSSSGDIFIAKFDGNLSGVWGELGNCALPGYVYGLGLDNQNNCIITGQFQSRVLFGNFNLSGGSQPEFFIAKVKAH